MQRTSFADMDCPIARTLEVVGEWWTPLILREVFAGRRRFDDIQAELGLSRKVLTQRLGALVDHGVLERVPYSERPPRHEYHLTEKGSELGPVLMAMVRWGTRWELGGDPEAAVRRVRELVRLG
jgi:DNA-binding HxlR family transcriptional regulator